MCVKVSMHECNVGIYMGFIYCHCIIKYKVALPSVIENNKGKGASSSQRNKKKIAKVAGYKKASRLFMAEWWKRLLIFPVKRIWLSLYSRLNSRKNKSGGILKLKDDVQTCEYEDVQVMWEMLRRSKSELMDSSHSKTHLNFSSVFVWSKSHHNSSTSPTSESAYQP